MESVEGYARFESLTEDETVALLRTHEVGRVGWTSANGPVILPVAYAFDDGVLAFRTAEGGLLAGLAGGTRVAFEIDDVDAETGTGWSVLVQATSAQVTETKEVEAWVERLPAPWAPGERSLVLRLVPDRITGRVVVRR